MSTKIPYNAESVNGRGMEWRVPLWNGIEHWHQSVHANSIGRYAAVVEIEAAVAVAQKIAIEAYQVEVCEAIGVVQQEKATPSSLGRILGSAYAEIALYRRMAAQEVVERVTREVLKPPQDVKDGAQE